VSNLVQSIGTILNIRWVVLGRASPGTLCSLQGGVKQAGNVGTAVWSFALALHAFCLLFLRTRLTTRSKWITLASGWTFVIFVVTIGPLAIQKKALGPYFGPSGFWCWIAAQYPTERIFLEYMLEWTSALFSFVLYVIVLLRVRGNLIQDTAGKWSFQWIPRSESWRLGFVRDYLDSCTVKLAAIIVWYPVTYTVLVVPISIARFASYAGVRVPNGFTFFADLIFAPEVSPISCSSSAPAISYPTSAPYQISRHLDRAWTNTPPGLSVSNLSYSRPRPEIWMLRKSR